MPDPDDERLPAGGGYSSKLNFSRLFQHHLRNSQDKKGMHAQTGQVTQNQWQGTRTQRAPGESNRVMAPKLMLAMLCILVAAWSSESRILLGVLTSLQGCTCAGCGWRLLVSCKQHITGRCRITTLEPRCHPITSSLGPTMIHSYSRSWCPTVRARGLQCPEHCQHVVGFWNAGAAA